MKAFQAYGKAGRITRDTARTAAMDYFDAFPASRKCNVVEGKTEGPFFVQVYDLRPNGDRPARYVDVTKKTAPTLPDVIPA